MEKTNFLFSAVLLLFLFPNKSDSQNNDRIIFKDDKGNQLTFSDLEGATGTYNYEIMDDKKISKNAIRLHQEARQHGGNGEYDSAIQKLLSANRLAPNWAYPIYDLAYTYLLQNDFENSLKYYEMTDRMEPKGFFTSKTAYWALKKESEGKFQSGLYLAFMQIEWLNSDEEKLKIARAIINKYPDYAPAWKVIAGKAQTHSERLDAIKNGLNSDPDLETLGILLINKALIEDVNGNTEAATKILGDLIFDEKTTFANIEIAKLVMSSITKRN